MPTHTFGAIPPTPEGFLSLLRDKRGEFARFHALVCAEAIFDEFIEALKDYFESVGRATTGLEGAMEYSGYSERQLRRLVADGVVEKHRGEFVVVTLPTRRTRGATDMVASDIAADASAFVAASEARIARGDRRSKGDK